MRPNLELKSFREKPHPHDSGYFWNSTKLKAGNPLTHPRPIRVKNMWFSNIQIRANGAWSSVMQICGHPGQRIHWDVFDLSGTARISESFKRVLELFSDVSWVNEFELYRQCYAFHHRRSVATPSCFKEAIKAWSVDFVEEQADKKWMDS